MLPLVQFAQYVDHGALLPTASRWRDIPGPSPARILSQITENRKVGARKLLTFWELSQDSAF